MQLTAAGIVALVILLICIVFGWWRGFVKEVISLLFLIFVFVLAGVISPRVETFVRDNTGAYNWVHTRCEELVDSVVPDEETLTAVGSRQEELIRELRLPDFLKNELVRKNTEETYRSLDVTGFADYISTYLTRKFFGGIVYLASLVLAGVLLGIAAAVLKAMARLPGIRVADRLLGAAVGFAKGLILIWLVMFVLTLLYRTQTGSTILDNIYADRLLNVLYENNPLTKMFLSV